MSNAFYFRQKVQCRNSILYSYHERSKGYRMSKTVSFKNHDRFVQIGIAIVALRKLCGMSQEKLAEKAGISRSLLSVIEAPGTAHNFTLDVFFDIADALNVDPADLISASMIPEKMLKGRNSKE